MSQEVLTVISKNPLLKPPKRLNRMMVQPKMGRECPNSFRWMLILTLYEAI